MTTPSDIIAAAIHKAPNMRLPLARQLAKRIMDDLAENGYRIIDETEARQCQQTLSSKAILSASK